MYANKTCWGWREWVSLPSWKINKIKAKLDSGARTCALHAEDVEIYRSHGRSKVKFRVFPLQDSKRRSRKIVAELVELRKVRSSNGVVTERPVVSTDLCIGDEIWPIEVTLVNRDIMGFRMLIGRAALKHRAVIDPGRSFLAKKRTLSLIELL